MPKRTILDAHRGMLGLQAWGDGLIDTCPLSRVWCLPVVSRVRCLRSVCPAQDSQIFFGGEGKSDGPHACVHGGQPTVILRVPSTERQVNAWTCARRATDRALESQREFFVRMLGYVLVGQPTVIFRVSAQ